MGANERRPRADEGASAKQLQQLHPRQSIEPAMDTWCLFTSRGLDSELVWHVLFEPFGLCYCVRCPTYTHGDQR